MPRRGARIVGASRVGWEDSRGRPRRGLGRIVGLLMSGWRIVGASRVGDGRILRAARVRMEVIRAAWVRAEVLNGACAMMTDCGCDGDHAGSDGGLGRPYRVLYTHYFWRKIPHKGNIYNFI